MRRKNEQTGYALAEALSAEVERHEATKNGIRQSAYERQNVVHERLAELENEASVLGSLVSSS